MWTPYHSRVLSACHKTCWKPLAHTAWRRKPKISEWLRFPFPNFLSVPSKGAENWTQLNIWGSHTKPGLTPIKMKFTQREDTSPRDRSPYSMAEPDLEMLSALELTHKFTATLHKHSRKCDIAVCLILGNFSCSVLYAIDWKEHRHLGGFR